LKDGVSLIVVNYFSEKYIEPLIESIMKDLDIKNIEFIIVNNSKPSFSWSKDFIEQNNIRFIDSGGNVGFARAVNLGVKESKYSFFCMMNPDIQVDDGKFLNELYNFFLQQDRSVGAISPLVKNEHGIIQTSYFLGGSLKKWPFFKNLIVNNLLKRRVKRDFKHRFLDFSKPIEVTGFWGIFVMLRKEAFLDVGGFDPDFFMYSEDVELFRHRFSKKYKSILYPYVSIVHFGSKTDRYDLMEHQSQVSYLLYLRKEGNYYLFTFVIIFSIRYLMILLLSKKDSSKKEARGFFKSLKYLKTILKYPRGYGVLPNCLKVDEIPD